MSAPKVLASLRAVWLCLLQLGLLCLPRNHMNVSAPTSAEELSSRLSVHGVGGVVSVILAV
eukprot:2971090-Amphidinium_carterae.1